MTIMNAFLDQIKKGDWSIHHIRMGKRYKTGDRFKVSVSRNNSITKITLYDKNCEEKDVLVPIKGSLKVEVTDCNIHTIYFDYKNKYGDLKSMFLRHFFFENDPTLFRFREGPVLDFGGSKDPKEDCDCCSCCDSASRVYLAYSIDEDCGFGGPGLN